MHVHPRGLHCSKEDLQNLGEPYDMRTKYSLAADLANSDNAAMNVVEIVGDVHLSTRDLPGVAVKVTQVTQANLPLLPA